MIKAAFLSTTLLTATALGQPTDSLPNENAVAPESFAPRDVFELERAGDPRISPDGSRVVYARLGFDVLTDSTTSELWIIDADGSNHQRLLLLEGGQSSPRWSPQGDRIAFVGTHEGRRQVFVHWLDTGRTGAISRVTRSPSDITWSPDGDHIAFSMFVPDSPAARAALPEAPAGADWGPPIEVEDRLNYRLDGRGQLEPGRQHLFVIPADGGSPRQLTDGDHDHRGPFSWTPDGRSIVLSANRRDDKDEFPLDSDLHRVDVRTGAVTQLTDRFGPDGSPAISPDGAMIAYTGFDDRYQGYQPERLYVCEIDGSNPRLISGALDREVASPTWSAQGDRVYFQYDTEGRTRIAEWPIDLGGSQSGSAPMRDIAHDLGGMSLGRPYGGGSFTVADTGDVAYTLGVASGPAEIVVTRAGGGEPAPITRLNHDLFADTRLGEVEEFWVESSVDGSRVQGWIVYPPNFDPGKTYPMVLEIHGGPFANYGPRFSAECQLFASAGYVVVYTNPRGSTSYGAEFGNAIHHAYPGDDYHDLIDCVDHVIDRGFIDEDRLFVTGGSGGGVLTAWIVGSTDRFRAAVVQKPVINWYSFVLYADVPAFFFRYWFPGPPWEHERHYMERSPISLVGDVTTPTMLLTGSRDLRTPLHETEQYYTALKIRGVATKLVRVPDAYHGIASRPSNLIAKVAEILSWFEAHGGAAGEAGD